MAKPRKFSPEFKAKIALAVLRGEPPPPLVHLAVVPHLGMGWIERDLMIQGLQAPERLLRRLVPQGGWSTPAPGW